VPDLDRLRRIAETEFFAVVRSTTIVRNKLRVVLTDDSYIDFWWSTQILGRYAHHWERRHVDGTIYRHDNMPHPQWQGVLSPNISMLKTNRGSWRVRYQMTLSRQCVNSLRLPPARLPSGVSKASYA